MSDSKLKEYANKHLSTHMWDTLQWEAQADMRSQLEWEEFPHRTAGTYEEADITHLPIFKKIREQSVYFRANIRKYRTNYWTAFEIDVNGSKGGTGPEDFFEDVRIVNVVPHAQFEQEFMFYMELMRKSLQDIIDLYDDELDLKTDGR